VLHATNMTPTARYNPLNNRRINSSLIGTVQYPTAGNPGTASPTEHSTGSITPGKYLEKAREGTGDNGKDGRLSIGFGAGLQL
ncbi:MAG: hypothetical protein ACP5JG_08865, partial [Anaerolineae bacterium]